MRSTTYRIEARDSRYGWGPAPGESGGWTLPAARHAVRAGLVWHDGTPIASGDVRIVREATLNPTPLHRPATPAR